MPCRAWGYGMREIRPPFPVQHGRSGMRTRSWNNARVDHGRIRCGHACGQCRCKKIAETRVSRADQCTASTVESAFVSIIAKHAAPQHRPNPIACCAVKALFANPRTPSVPNIRGMSLKSPRSQVLLRHHRTNGFYHSTKQSEHVAIPAYCGTYVAANRSYATARAFPQSLFPCDSLPSSIPSGGVILVERPMPYRYGTLLGWLVSRAKQAGLQG